MIFRSPDDLSKRAREVLQWLYDNRDDDDILTDGIHVCFGLERTSWSTLNQLLECCFVKQCSPEENHYAINGSGCRFIEGKLPYTDENGKDHATIFDTIQARK